jgi:hypothetical protein
MSYPLSVELHERLKQGIEACHERMLNKRKNREISFVLVDMAEAVEEVSTLHLLPFQMATLTHQCDWLVHCGTLLGDHPTTSW